MKEPDTIKEFDKYIRNRNEQMKSPFLFIGGIAHGKVIGVINSIWYYKVAHPQDLPVMPSDGKFSKILLKADTYKKQEFRWDGESDFVFILDSIPESEYNHRYRELKNQNHENNRNVQGM